MSLPSTSIKRPVTITMFYVGIALLSIYAFSRIGVDLLPDVNIPHLLIQTNYPNASSEEVEKLVTQPLESTIATITSVKDISSVSQEGLSVISVDFAWGTNMDYAFLSTREKLDNIRFLLPDDTERPTIVRIDPSSTPIMSLIVTYQKDPSDKDDKDIIKFVDYDSKASERKKLIDLKEISRVVFKRRLEQIDGVAQAVLTGGLERQIDVEINSDKLIEYNLTFNEIADALKNSNVSFPAGTILNGLFRYSLRTIGEFQNIDDIKNAIIKRNEDGSVFYLNDIATVKESFKEREGLTRFNGKESVGILIYKEPQSNTVDISGEVNNVVNQLNNEYPEYNVAVVTDYSNFIVNAIQNVQQEIFYGGILAFIVLFFFLSNLKSVFTIGITIPASLVLVVLLMYLFGINFNIVSLGGIALGIGMLLDNAIIVIENITRYKEEGLSLKDATLKGTEEVKMPIITATLTTIAVFIPLIFLQGIAGELFKEQSYAVIFSLLSSILVAITLVPMLYSRARKSKSSQIVRKDEQGNNIVQSENKSQDYIYFYFPKEGNIFSKIIFWLKFPFLFLIQSVKLIINSIFAFAEKFFNEFFSKFFKKVDNGLNKTIEYYEKLLLWSLNNRAKVLLITLGLVALTIFAVIDIKKEFIPEGPNDELILELTFPKGTSLRGNAELTSNIENELLKFGEVKSIISNIGRVNEFDFLNKEQISEDKTNILIKLYEQDYYYSIQDKIRDILKNLNLVEFSFQQPKTTYSQVIDPSEDDIEIKIKNNNIDEAISKANSVIKSIKDENVNGIKDLRLGINKGEPQYVLEIDKEKCLAYNLDINTVANQIVHLVKGLDATYFTDFDKKISVNLKTPEYERNDIEKILSFNVINDGNKIPLRNLVNYKLTESYNEIWRENQSRTVYVYANVVNENIDNVITKVNGIITNSSRNAGEIISVGGANQEINDSFRVLIAALIISVLLMFIVLASEFESFLYPFIIIFSIPLGLIGGILILYFLGESISIISIMGLVILVGIADNDAVVKVEFIIRKRKEGLSVKDAIIEAGKNRFRPIVMNSFTVIFGLIPMMIGIGAATQLRSSLSLAIVGGLISSTFLTLIIIPVLYTYLEKYSKKEY